jgi:hypothetical protein
LSKSQCIRDLIEGILTAKVLSLVKEIAKLECEGHPLIKI